jgi:hypothetical protein
LEVVAEVDLKAVDLKAVDLMAEVQTLLKKSSL